LKTHTPNDLMVSDTRLKFQEKVILEQGKIRRDSKKSFAKMNEDGDLRNRIGIKMDQLDLVMIKKTAEKVTSREAKSVLKEIGEHHNLICIGCWNVFPGGRTPLQHGAVWEKVVCSRLADLTFICNEPLEQVRVRGGHGWKEKSYYGERSMQLRRRWRREEMRREMVVVREMVRVSGKSPFNSSGNEGARNGSLKLHLGFWVNGQIYPNGKESLISSISQ
jgi:hypothetical protein